MSLPRHDYYQTDTHLILSLYVKGYNDASIKDDVDIKFEQDSIVISLPAIGDRSAEAIEIAPLYQSINPEGSSYRIVSTKIELKLAKTTPANWQSLTTTSSAPPAIPLRSAPTAPVSIQEDKSKKKVARNWDKMVDEELNEKEDSSDPNGGGDAALQKLFAGIYANADADTKKAMIKSYTESGGTTLSTDWSSISKETTPIRPPDGMEARRN